MNYRNLLPNEILQLEKQDCRAIDGWEQVLVCDKFITINILSVTFSGKNYLGLFSERLETVNDYSGIYNSHIHNCTIKNQTYIKNIGSILSSYTIEDRAIIVNTDQLMVTGETSFGNGEPVSPINEAGGREVYIYNHLSVHTAYLMAFYKEKNKLQSGLKKIVTDYTKGITSNKGIIGHASQIINCGNLINIKTGPFATLEGVTHLKNGTVNSSEEAPSYVGFDVNCENFIFDTSSTIGDGAYLRHCFIGQGCEISNHYTAENSLFFSNSQCLQGEACSIFAGPFTVTHHKSTLLIAGHYSFFNAGSGTNQSNHMYKLGPVHQGIAERGCKTGSDSYILWPAKIGAFTMILGRHYGNPDISELPFSYLIEDSGKSILMPAQNLFNVGTKRDVEKWPKRDKRKGKNLHDYIISEALNPFTINKTIKAIEVLKSLQDKSSPNGKNIMYKNTQISLTSINRGIKLYEQALVKYIGDELTSLLKQTRFEKVKYPEFNLNQIDEWIDLGGLILKKKNINDLITKLEINEINSETINRCYKTEYEDYALNKKEHVFQVFKSYFKIDINKCDSNDLRLFIENWITNNDKIFSSISMDARKEFNNKCKIGFGIDGDETIREHDFESVRGTIESNSFLTSLKSELENLNQLGKNTIESLSN